ncbi:molybdopterin molybdotransferase MoeA [Hippea maritima]|uniref:Molybdopterin molybdenumtransferase n=1 Tax=Hippea maritima (strain ATCC 700847 / DSM 10411 / MH2) TaxID=760142 RepID=F2LVH6_HIPMA|nr:molybdopterin molybdotransferase MoeA [Hippea maritima]AEA33760.1 molybdenum cofactor synthesis domain protein [Hippea maritima DSM 10411]
MITPFEALDIILNNMKPLGKQKISIFEADKRVVADYIYSKLDLPPQDNSAMDGYAIRFKDIQQIPAKLKIKGTIKAGDSIDGLSVGENECFRIMTGAFIPKGADCVVEFEAAKEENGYVEILKQKKLYANIRFKGEDIEKNARIDLIGEHLNPYRLARIVSTGNIFIDVYTKPRICIIATGNELVYAGDTTPFATIDSNSLFVKSLLKEELNLDIDYLGISTDSQEDLKNLMETALNYDIIITTAGISFGDYDVVTNIEKQIGIEWLFKYVKQKPGKPFAFGKIKDSFIFSFPGNPVSTAFCSFFYLLPALKKMMGLKKYLHIPIKAKLKKSMVKRNDRVHFNRVKVEFKNDNFYATPFETQGSNIIESIAQCNGFAMVESFRLGEIAKGEEVDVFMYDFKSIFEKRR